MAKEKMSEGQAKQRLNEKDKQWSTKQYTENYRFSNSSPFKTGMNSGAP